MNEIASMLFTAGKAAYRADRKNRYALRKPWPLPRLNVELPAYDGPYINIVPDGKQARITVKPYSGDTCDGANYVPDTGSVLPAAIFHDPWYLEIPAMAKAWGWDEDRVRKVGDGILSTIMLRAKGSHMLARIYYNFCWYGGGLFRRGSKAKLLPVAGIVAICIGLSGCTSCLNPPDWSDPADPYVPPDIEKIAQFAPSVIPRA